MTEQPASTPRVFEGPETSLAETVQALRSAKRPVLLIHRNPDGDCVGSALALAEGLSSLGAQVSVVSPDPLTGALLDIPGAERIGTSLDAAAADLIVSIDVSDPKLLLPLEAADAGFFQQFPSLNIDHHFSNLRYARQNYVDVAAASAAEIIHEILSAMGYTLTAASATDLLYGVVNDTHSFQNSNTTARTLHISADLLEYGAPLDTVVYKLLLERTVSSARLWAQVLPSLSFKADGGFASLVVSQEALIAAQASMQDADGLVDFLRNIRGVSLAVLFKQLGNTRYRLSLRSDDTVDSTVVAGVYGGGGHRRASGCDADGSFEQILAKLLTAYQQSRLSPGA